MTRLEAWETILRSSFEILELAKERRWEEAATRHADRQAMLEAFFAGYDVSDIPDTIAAGIDDMLRADQQLGRLVEDGRGEIGASMSRLRAGAEALRAYADTP